MRFCDLNWLPLNRHTKFVSRCGTGSISCSGDFTVLVSFCSVPAMPRAALIALIHYTRFSINDFQKIRKPAKLGFCRIQLSLRLNDVIGQHLSKFLLPNNLPVFFGLLPLKFLQLFITLDKPFWFIFFKSNTFSILQLDFGFSIIQKIFKTSQ